MSIRVNTPNQSTLTALRKSQDNQKNQRKNMEKLTSGTRVNRAADDAAALAIAQQMGQAIKGLEQGMENVYDGISLTQVADGAVSQAGENLIRMRELGMTAANGTLSPEQRDAVNAEYTSLRAEITRISQTTEFNGKKLLDGSAGDIEISLGTQSGGSADTLALDLSQSLDSASLGLDSTTLAGDDGSNAKMALDEIDDAMAMLNSQRAEIGSFSNRLSSASQSLGITMENTYAAQSRLQDADYATESANQARDQILGQVNQAVRIQSQGMAGTALNLLK